MEPRRDSGQTQSLTTFMIDVRVPGRKTKQKFA
jgi:hypothetical protein